MAITEEARHRMYVRLEEVLGSEEAATMMEHLPPVGWADVATKRDLDHHAAMTKRDLDQHTAMTKRDLDQHTAMTKRDLDQHTAIMKRDLAIMKRDLEQHTAMIKQDLDDFRSEFDAKLENLGNVLRLEFTRGMNRILLAVMATNTTLTAVAIAAVRFG